MCNLENCSTMINGFMFVQMRRQVELYQWWLARACQWISSVSPFKHFTPPNQSKGCDSISQFYHSCFAARLVSVIYILYIGVCVCISTSLAPSICNRTIKAICCSDAFGLRFVTTERLQHNHVSTATQFLAGAWKKTVLAQSSTLDSLCRYVQM